MRGWSRPSRDSPTGPRRSSGVAFSVTTRDGDQSEQTPVGCVISPNSSAERPRARARHHLTASPTATGPASSTPPRGVPLSLDLVSRQDTSPWLPVPPARSSTPHAPRTRGAPSASPSRGTQPTHHLDRPRGENAVNTPIRCFVAGSLKAHRATRSSTRSTAVVDTVIQADSESGLIDDLYAAGDSARCSTRRWSELSGSPLGSQRRRLGLSHRDLEAGVCLWVTARLPAPKEHLVEELFHSIFARCGPPMGRCHARRCLPTCGTRSSTTTTSRCRCKRRSPTSRLKGSISKTQRLPPRPSRDDAAHPLRHDRSRTVARYVR